MPTPITRHLRLGGRVQGVSFRESLARRARELQLSGWVRNRSDGTLEAVIQGEAVAVEVLIDWARRGPPAARVDHFEVCDVEGEYRGFEKRPSV